MTQWRRGFAFFTLSQILAFSAAAAELQVRLHNVRSSQGQILVSVYDRADGFPDDPQAALQVRRVLAREAEQTLTFKNLTPGTYAVAFIHDENGNGSLDTNFVGIPKEGFGFSNDPRLAFGPPSFAAAAVELRPEGSKIRAKMRYY